MRRRYFAALSLLLVSGCFGSPVDQAPQCARYVACVRALDAAAGATTDLARYVPDGACWHNATTAEFCTTSCRRGLERFQERLTDRPPECAP